MDENVIIYQKKHGSHITSQPSGTSLCEEERHNLSGGVRCGVWSFLFYTEDCIPTESIPIMFHCDDNNNINNSRRKNIPFSASPVFFVTILVIKPTRNERELRLDKARLMMEG